MDAIRVLIADDHPVVRQGLRTFLQLQKDIQVIGEAATGEEAVALAGELAPEVVLMDLVMPDLDGIEATRRIHAASPATRVIVLTSFAQDDKVFPAIRAGAAGYLLKDVEPQQLAEAVRAARRGESLLHPRIADRLLRELAGGPQSELLTERQLDVLRLIGRGLPNKLIARELVVSEKTVKTHVSNILSKLELSDRTQAALYAVRNGLV